jgi:hypothetical protein
MLKQIPLIVSEDELHTIYFALENVQWWHRMCINKGISVVEHEKLMVKNEKFITVIATLIREQE